MECIDEVLRALGSVLYDVWKRVGHPENVFEHLGSVLGASWDVLGSFWRGLEGALYHGGVL